MTMETSEVTLSTPDVSCEHCVNTINGALGKLAGVQRVSTDLATKSVHLTIDPGVVSVEQIEAALDEEGYPVAK